jgi:hypothetical protein
MYNPAEVQTYNFRRALAIAPSLVTYRVLPEKRFREPHRALWCGGAHEEHRSFGCQA